MRSARGGWIALPLLAAVIACGGPEPRAERGVEEAVAKPLAARADRRVAVTFDDLPVIEVVRCDDACRETITADLLAAIAAHRVPAVGFVNEDKLEEDGRAVPRRVALLRRWIDAGLELGNHTYSHPDFHRTPLADFQAEVLRGERVTRPLMEAAGRKPRWFRHPFLRTGRGLEDRAAFERFLGEHGYRVAPVSVDNHDYVFAAAYARAHAAADTAAKRRVGAEYLDYMERIFAYHEAQARTIVGRDIPHVLLLHANRLNADLFGELARRLEARGYSFVTLDEAMADPAYRSEDRYTGPAGITWLHRWAITRGMRGSVFAGEPEVPTWVQEMSERRG
jgi:peptidoglycan/xylan/chitin deacetylase (PgdA/CDA1 family)